MTPETIANQSADADHAHASSGSSVTQIRITDRTKGFILGTLIALNAVATIAMFAEWRISERESRMLQYYLLELDAKFIAAGLKRSDDSIAKHLKER